MNEMRMITASRPRPELPEKDALMHYGVLGMKWGIRRYQPYGHGGYNPENEGVYKGPKTAGQFRKQLNKAERQLAKVRYQANKAEKKMNRDYQKLAKDSSIQRVQNANNDIMVTNSKKFDKASKSLERYMELDSKVKEGKKFIQDTIAKANEMGYEVTSKEKMYTVNKGMSVLQGMATFALSGGSIVAMKTHSVFGHKHDVTEKQTPKETNHEKYWKNGPKNGEELASWDENKIRKSMKDAGIDDEDFVDSVLAERETRRKNDPYFNRVKVGKEENKKDVVVNGKTNDGEKFSIGTFETHKDDSDHRYDYNEAKATIGDRSVRVITTEGSPKIAKETASKVLKDFKSIEKSVQERAVKEMYDYLDIEVPLDKFKKSIKMQSMYPLDDGTVSLTFWSIGDDGQDYLSGHSYDVDYDPNRKKIGSSGMNG